MKNLIYKMKREVLLIFFLIFFIPFSYSNQFWYENIVESNNTEFKSFSIELISFPRDYISQNVSNFCNYDANVNQYEVLQSNNPFLKCVYSIETYPLFYRLKENKIKTIYYPNKYLDDYKLATVLNFDNLYLNNDRSEIENIYSIYKFVKNYITYESNLDTLNELNISEILKTQKGVCDEYVNLFNEFMKYIGYDVKYVSGYIYERKEFEPHAWSEVRINGEWIPIDLTFNEFGFLNQNHIAFNKDEKSLENRDILVNYINSENNITIDTQHNFFLLDEKEISKKIMIDYTLKSSKKLDSKYDILTILFENNNDYYIPLDFTIGKYKEIDYYDINYEYKRYLFDEYLGHDLDEINYVNNVYNFIERLDKLEYSNEFSTLLAPNQIKSFKLLIVNNYQRDAKGVLNFKIQSLNDFIHIDNTSTELEIVKPKGNNEIEIINNLENLIYNDDDECQISLEDKINITCDYEICFKNNCNYTLLFDYNTINLNEKISYKDYSSQYVDLTQIDPIKNIEIYDLINNKTFNYSSSLVLNNTNKIEINIDFIINPDKVLYNNHEDNIINLNKEKNVTLIWDYNNVVFSKNLYFNSLNDTVKSDNNSNNSYLDYIRYLILAFVLLFLLIILKRNKTKKIKITHKTFSHSIKILAVDIFNNIKKLDKDRKDFELKKDFRVIISKLEEINNDYINLFFNLYELDKILDKKGQKRMKDNIRKLKEKIIFLKKEYIEILKVLKDKKHSIYDDMHSKLKHFSILIKFLDDKNSYLKR